MVLHHNSEEALDVAQRRPQIVRHGPVERLELAIRAFERQGPIAHPLLEVGIQTPDLLVRALARLLQGALARQLRGEHAGILAPRQRLSDADRREHHQPRHRHERAELGAPAVERLAVIDFDDDRPVAARDGARGRQDRHAAVVGGLDHPAHRAERGVRGAAGPAERGRVRLLEQRREHDRVGAAPLDQQALGAPGVSGLAGDARPEARCGIAEYDDAADRRAAGLVAAERRRQPDQPPAVGQHHGADDRSGRGDGAPNERHDLLGRRGIGALAQHRGAFGIHQPDPFEAECRARVADDAQQVAGVVCLAGLLRFERRVEATAHRRRRREQRGAGGVLIDPGADRLRSVARGREQPVAPVVVRLAPFAPGDHGEQREHDRGERRDRAPDGASRRRRITQWRCVGHPPSGGERRPPAVPFGGALVDVADATEQSPRRRARRRAGGSAAVRRR